MLSVLMAATVANNQVRANDEVKDTVAKANPTRQLLAHGAQNEFARFVQKTEARTALGNFLTVVNLYDAAPAQFLKADAQTRSAFRASVQKLNEGLAKVKGPEAATWLERVNRTANTISFLWNYQPDNAVFSVTDEAVPAAGSVINL